MRVIETTLSNILDLASCATDYGYADDILMQALYDMTGGVSDIEIVEFADQYLSPDMQSRGYTQEDVDQISERLTSWRDKWRDA